MNRAAVLLLFTLWLSGCTYFEKKPENNDPGLDMSYFNDYGSAVNMTETIIEPEGEGFRNEPTRYYEFPPNEPGPGIAWWCGDDEEWEEYRIRVQRLSDGAILDEEQWLNLPCKNYELHITSSGHIVLAKAPTEIDQDKVDMAISIGVALGLVALLAVGGVWLRGKRRRSVKGRGR